MSKILRAFHTVCFIDDAKRWFIRFRSTPLPYHKEGDDTKTGLVTIEVRSHGSSKSEWLVTTSAKTVISVSNTPAVKQRVDTFVMQLHSRVEHFRHIFPLKKKIISEWLITPLFVAAMFRVLCHQCLCIDCP